MRRISTGFWLDFRRVASRRVSGNVYSLLLEIVWQPFVVALIVFAAYINRDDIDAYRCNFLYFSTLYAFWIGLFGACQAINSEMKSGEWCYWVLGMERNRTVHVLAIFSSCLLFAFIQCLMFLIVVVALSGAADMPFNHFVDMFVKLPDGRASVDPIYQMNGALWYVLSAKWGALGPAVFATSIFGFALVAALVTGTSFGLLSGSLFREPATSLNKAVGFVVLLGMVSLCGLKGSGNKVDENKMVEASFALLREKMSDEYLRTNNIPWAVVSYILPQRYFYNIGSVTFEKDWSRIDVVYSNRCTRIHQNVRVGHDYPDSDQTNKFHARWLEKFDGVTFPVVSGENGVMNWIKLTKEEYFRLCNQEIGTLIQFLRDHPEYYNGWRVALCRRNFLSTIGLETLPLLLLNVICLAGTLLAVWKKQCYQQLR